MRTKGSRALAGLGAAMWIGLAATGAHAQPRDTDDFSAAGYRPAPGPSALFELDGAEVVPLAGPYVAGVFDYALRPLEVSCPAELDCTTQDAALVEHLALLHLIGSWAFGDRLQLSLVVPLAFVSGESLFFTDRSTDPPTFDDDLGGGSFAGLGDVRVHAKVRLAGGRTEGAAAALVGFVNLPTGRATMPDAYVGDAPLTFGGHLAGQVFLGPVSIVANLGAAWREPASVLGTKVRPGLRFGLGALYTPVPTVDVLAEIAGASSLGAADDPLEVRVGGRLRVDPVRLGAGVGLGLGDAPGVPDVRVLASVEWIPRPVADTDGDGVPDQLDPCPEVAEDLDGHQDEDGCPDGDNDGDRVPDIEDGCPDDAEDLDGFEDDDGCVDDDNDGDGITDGFDSCPDRAEDVDGDHDEDGCPDDDPDGDGVPNAQDACPDAPEDTDGLADEDGCPETDADRDGVPDDRDECPEEPETRNGRRDRDGCPD